MHDCNRAGWFPSKAYPFPYCKGRGVLHPYSIRENARQEYLLRELHGIKEMQCCLLGLHYTHTVTKYLSDSSHST